MPQGVQAFERQPSLGPEHDVQLAPPVPQAEYAVPARQPKAGSQQPAQPLPLLQTQEPPEQVRPVPQVVPLQHASPTPPQATQAPLAHVRPLPHTLQLPPVVPQAELGLPVWHPVSPQQPVAHEAAVQTQLPLEQARFALQVVPLQQTSPKAPQESHFPAEQLWEPLQTAQLPPAAPQAAELLPNSQPLPSQQPLAHEAEVQPQISPEQASPGLQTEPPQQASLSAPQPLHDPELQFWPGLHALQLPAAGPQAVSDVPPWQTPFASQQPVEQDAEVQAHLLLWQARPVLQLDLPQQSWPLRPQPVQLPPRHCWPAVQVVPQVPQFWPSVRVFTQRALQSVSPARQLAWQLLFAQPCPGRHACAQLPQLFTSAVRLAQYVWAPTVQVE
jgi:hypothetical protein